MNQSLFAAPKRLIWKTAQATARSFGFELKRAPIAGYQLKSLVADVPHEVIRATATYAPWRNDAEFLAAYREIQRFTLVDIYRCYELWTLVGQVARLCGDVIEIGVWRGGTGALIAHRLKSAAPDRIVYLCDTFAGVAGAGVQDTRYRGGEHADTTAEIVRGLLDRMELKNVRVVVGVFPHETADYVSSDKLAMVHIDVDVHDSAKWCFDWTWPRLVPGGVVVFDDYGFHGCEGVTRLVNAIERADATIIYNLNGHAIAVKNQ